MKMKLFLLLIASSIFTGCVVYEYSPSYQPTPEIQKKGDFWAYSNIRNLSLCYALSDKYYVSTSYSYMHIHNRSNYVYLPIPFYNDHDSSFTTSKLAHSFQGSFGYYKCTDQIRIQTGLTLGYSTFDFTKLNYLRGYCSPIRSFYQKADYILSLIHISIHLLQPK